MTTRDADGVVSGTDAAAAPVKPARVEPRQRWRDRLGEYEVVAPAAGGWCIRYDKSPDVLFKRAAVAILAEEYLGMAPVETPPKVSPSGKPVWFPESPAETPAPPGPKPEWYGHMQQRFLHKERPGDAPAAPAPPGPVKGTALRRCLWCVREFDPGENHGATLCSAACGVAQRDAAPAPGVGEGAHDLTFAEAMALDQSEVEVRWNDINDWRVVAEILSAFPLKSWRMARYRRRPEPLPAPKPGKLDGLVDEWCDRDAPMPMDLARDVAREALVCVRRQRGFVPADFESCLERAAVELLGAEAGK